MFPTMVAMLVIKPIANHATKTVFQLMIVHPAYVESVLSSVLLLISAGYLRLKTLVHGNNRASFFCFSCK